MSDPTEELRRELVAEINIVPGSREDLEQQYGQVWDTQELGNDFIVLSFLAPFIDVIRKSDQKKGTLMFQHHPRFYFSFNEYDA